MACGPLWAIFLACIHTLDTHYCMNQSFNLMKWSFLKEKSDPSRPFGKAKAWEGTAAATAPTRETDGALRAWLGRGRAPKAGSARQFWESATVREKPRLGPTRLYKTNQISMLKIYFGRESFAAASKQASCFSYRLAKRCPPGCLACCVPDPRRTPFHRRVS